MSRGRNWFNTETKLRKKESLWLVFFALSAGDLSDLCNLRAVGPEQLSGPRQGLCVPVTVQPAETPAHLDFLHDHVHYSGMSSSLNWLCHIIAFLTWHKAVSHPFLPHMTQGYVTSFPSSHAQLAWRKVEMSKVEKQTVGYIDCVGVCLSTGSSVNQTDQSLSRLGWLGSKCCQPWWFCRLDISSSSL